MQLNTACSNIKIIYYFITDMQISFIAKINDCKYWWHDFFYLHKNIKTISHDNDLEQKFVILPNRYVWIAHLSVSLYLYEMYYCKYNLTDDRRYERRSVTMSHIGKYQFKENTWISNLKLQAFYMVGFQIKMFLNCIKVRNYITYALHIRNILRL